MLLFKNKALYHTLQQNICIIIIILSKSSVQNISRVQQPTGWESNSDHLCLSPGH